MNTEQMSVARECATLSTEGKIHFGEVVARLMAAGVERYHADYSRNETTYYWPDGSTCVVPMKHGVVPIEHEPTPIAVEFSAAGVEGAVRQAQRGVIMYPEFTRQVLAAGCVGYFVQISGKCVQYFGRQGEMHTEWFPGAKRS
jgi:uncharacterized protein YbcV (DUF1398 family)